MGRYVNVIKAPIEAAQLFKPISDYLISEGFEQIQYNGVTAWKKGHGIATGPQYVILSVNGCDIRLEAFIRYALLPGVYIGEMGIDGFFGAIPKGLLRKRVEEIERYIYSLWPQMAAQQSETGA